MKPLCVDDLDDNDVFYCILRIAEDEFESIVEDTPVFFYGQVIDMGAPFNESDIDEEKTYCFCPCCNKLFELDDSAKRSGSIKCPHCEREGLLADYRDEAQPLSEMGEQTIAYMQTYEDGYVLRLFKAYADYSGRDYDDYTRLGWYPDMRFFEYGREYYHDGQLKYFRNFQEDDIETQFVEVDNIDDSDFWIVNYDDSLDDMDSPYLDDLKGDYCNKPVMYKLTKSLSYKAFRALQKYGFRNLVDSMIFNAEVFPDSSKISEVLGVDYNQILSNVSEGILIKQLISARKLYKLNLVPTIQNINLMSEMERIDRVDGFILTPENARKIFKYLRNQQNKKVSEQVGSDYVDYITECTKLDFDMHDSRVLFPTNLLKAHTHTSSLIEIKANAENERNITAAYEKNHKLCEYDNGKFCVIMPQHCEDIILEGKRQSHCVGNYVERMAKGEDIILFLRRSNKKDKPFYTMEIRPIMRNLGLVQCRGYENQDPSPEIRAEVNAFLAEYQAWFNTRKLVCADKSTYIYYKAVKKIDGKYISAWDNMTEYIVGQIIESELDTNPDRVAVKGIHVASLEFAQRYGGHWPDVAILELEVDIKDIVVPDAKDQIRASRVKVIREVPFEEMGDWGAKRLASAD